jgi:hypothetical protein
VFSVWVGFSALLSRRRRLNFFLLVWIGWGVMIVFLGLTHGDLGPR